MLTKELENEVEKLNKIIAKDESPADAAEWAITEIVIQNAETHYQALGVLTEAMLRYREMSLEVLKEESNKESGEEEKEYGMSG